MSPSTLITLIVIFSLMLLIFQRTERKYRWVTALLMLLPGGWLLYRWSIYRGFFSSTLIALGVAVGLNLLFWLFYGRTHPPHSSDEIRVVGMEDD